MTLKLCTIRVMPNVQTKNNTLHSCTQSSLCVTQREISAVSTERLVEEQARPILGEVEKTRLKCDSYSALYCQSEARSVASRKSGVAERSSERELQKNDGAKRSAEQEVAERQRSGERGLQK